MLPIPIPQRLIPEGFTRTVIVDGCDLDRIYPVETVIGESHDGKLQCSFLLELTDDDVARINKGQRHMWYTVVGVGVSPFAFSEVFTYEESKT